MAINYKKLTGDLIRAKTAAEKAAKGEDAGGINLDTLSIVIPRATNLKIIAAVKDAGLFTSGRRDRKGSTYFIAPPRCGQSSSRKRAVQSMYEVMKLSGWEVSIHSQSEILVER